MSGKKYSYLLPLIVFVVFFLFSITLLAQPIIDRIKAGPGVDNPVEKRQSLADKIIREYAELETIFESENSPGNKMAKILGKKAVLVVGPENEKHSGKQEIKRFWNDKKAAGYQLEVLTLEWAFIVAEEKITEEMEDFDHIAYEYFTFRLIRAQAGKILKNQDGRGGRSCRHIHGCECRTR